MDIEQIWDKTISKTEVVRGRVRGLSTFSSTQVPYIFLAESALNEGHTLIRRGKVVVERPMILLPEDLPQFEGFDFEKDMDLEGDSVSTFFLVRGIRFPSLKYNNTVQKLDVKDLSLSKCIEKQKKMLEKKESVNTALIVGPEDCWQFSILLYVASLVGRCMRSDITNLMEKLKEK